MKKLLKQILKRIQKRTAFFFVPAENTEPIVGYTGNYETYDQAEAFVESVGRGYDSDTVFEKVKQSTLAVVSGKAVYERDSFLFYEKDINYNLMMYLYQFFLEDKKLNLIDFGGALGSTYFQHKKELNALHVKWTVVEQEHFVKFGKEHLETENLQFSVSHEIKNEFKNVNVVLLSSVLQYIRDIDSLLDSYCSKKITNIIIERTPVSDHNRFMIETVHEPIYESVRTFAVLKEDELIDRFEKRGYKLFDSWHSLVDGDIHIDGKTIQLKSFVFKFSK